MWGNDTETVSEKCCACESIATEESTVGFKHKIIFKIYNPKEPKKWGIRLFVLAESDTGYVHSIIPNYGKLMGNERNLPYSEKLFISRIVLSLMDRLCLSVSGTNDYHLFTDRYYSSFELAQELDNRKWKYTVCFFTLCPCCTNFSGKPLHLVAQLAFKNSLMSWLQKCFQTQ
jgi:hypothetical protein